MPVGVKIPFWTTPSVRVVRVLASALKALPLLGNNACQVGAVFCPMLICKRPRTVGNIFQAGIPSGNTNRR